jgi:hypothetical protein
MLCRTCEDDSIGEAALDTDLPAMGQQIMAKTKIISKK